MRKIFPFSFFGKNFKSVIFSSAIYTLFIVAAALVVFITMFFPLPDVIHYVINIARQIVLLWSVSGIVVSVLNACELLDKKWFE